jgi:recombinational DNA repair protein (RecF pathway)
VVGVMRQLQLPVDDGFSQRAMRRCHGCGEYARPAGFDRQRNAILCERCVAKGQRSDMERESAPSETAPSFDADPTKVDFSI